VKPVGKPDALIGHVRFDERGWETGRRSGVSTRAHPRLYKLAAHLTTSRLWFLLPAPSVRVRLIGSAEECHNLVVLTRHVTRQ
jgi:hypothetical protein